LPSSDAIYIWLVVPLRLNMAAGLGLIEKLVLVMLVDGQSLQDFF
jgi:hypothetical protein